MLLFVILKILLKNKTYFIFIKTEIMYQFKKNNLCELIYALIHFETIIND